MITYKFLFKMLYRTLKRRRFKSAWGYANMRIVWEDKLPDEFNPLLNPTRKIDKIKFFPKI